MDRSFLSTLYRYCFYCTIDVEEDLLVVLMFPPEKKTESKNK